MMCNNCECKQLLIELAKTQEDMKEVWIQSGIEKMKLIMLEACKTGKPIEIQGRAYFIKSDIDNLRNIFTEL